MKIRLTGSCWPTGNQPMPKVGPRDGGSSSRHARRKTCESCRERRDDVRVYNRTITLMGDREVLWSNYHLCEGCAADLTSVSWYGRVNVNELRRENDYFGFASALQRRR